jgi:hypothetical protein
MNKGLNMVFSGIFWMLMIGACFAPWIRSAGQNNSNSDKKKSKKINEKNLPDSFMYNLLAAYPQFFTSIISPKEALNVQVVYTQIDRDKKGKVKLTDHNFNLNPESYYYPASTVKLPIAILALQKLNELKQ